MSCVLIGLWQRPAIKRWDHHFFAKRVKQCAWGINFILLDYFSAEICLQSALWSDPNKTEFGSTGNHDHSDTIRQQGLLMWKAILKISKKGRCDGTEGFCF